MTSSDYPARRPGVIRSALGLVGPVSAYRDWVARCQYTVTGSNKKIDLQL